MAIQSQNRRTRARPFLRVLVGDGGSEGSDILACVVRHTLEEQYEVSVHRRGFAQDLIVAASRRRYHLFVLALPNIVLRGQIEWDYEERVRRAAELVPYLRQVYGARIVVVPGFVDGCLLHWLEQAGADVILPTPFTLEQFTDLVGTCLPAGPIGIPG